MKTLLENISKAKLIQKFFLTFKICYGLNYVFTVARRFSYYEFYEYTLKRFSLLGKKNTFPIFHRVALKTILVGSDIGIKRATAELIALMELYVHNRTCAKVQPHNSDK